ncbi:MAG TPA: IS1182 family transposase [Steroidobacteraceae bacterium]
MEINRWHPSTALSKREERLMGRLTRTRKLFRFLRMHRHELFDDGFQAELEAMYRESGAGRPPVPPALLAMALLLQGYTHVSDADVVEQTAVDARWQMVLDHLGSEEPAFSQGALCEFRNRLIRHDMDRRLLERTVELARQTKIFDWRKLPKTLRLAMDSSPLEGAGRVEDTLNLLAHAARKALTCAARLLERSPEQVATVAGAPMLVASSIKRALDLEWSDPEQKASALSTLVEQLDALEAWILEQLPEQATEPPLAEHLETLRQLRSQDLEPDPSGGGLRIRRGVAEDRRVSVQDKEMRHGRKSKSKRFNGYKRHVAADLDTDLILACAITPANRPEEEAVPNLQQDLARQPRSEIGELSIDRGYVGSDLVTQLFAEGHVVLCKPWVARNGVLFTKRDFHINMRDLTITCPAGQTERLSPGSVVEFDPETCAHCPMRARCTMAAPGTGRTISIARDEQLQHRFRKLTATPLGRQRLRRRVGVEHRLAHLSRKQGRRARYLGVRKNLFDTRRVAAVLNLETIHLREIRNAA